VDQAIRFSGTLDPLNARSEYQAVTIDHGERCGCCRIQSDIGSGFGAPAAAGLHRGHRATIFAETTELTLLGPRAYARSFSEVVSKRIHRSDADGHGDLINAMTLCDQERFRRLDPSPDKPFTRRYASRFSKSSRSERRR
jgi:hypothetical protein